MLLSVIAVTVAIIMYLSAMYDELVEAKEQEIALEVGEELRQIDVEVSEATTIVYATGNIMNQFRMDDNRNQLVYMLENILKESESNYAFVCDQEGKGFDHNNRDVDISGEDYFEALSAEYANGGSGMLMPSDMQSASGEILLVYGTKFANLARGYLVTYLPVRTINEQLFREKYLSDGQAIVALSGNIIICSKEFETTPERSNLIWDKLPPGLSKDAVKLAISQKNTLMTEVPGYGYAIVQPMYSANGGALVLINDSQMENMIGDGMAPGYRFCAEMVLISLAFIVLVILANIVGDRIEKAARLKASAEQETDIVTGLLTGEDTLKEIDSFAAEGSDQKGMLFVIGTNITHANTDEAGSSRVNDQLREFARLLKAGFRASDVIGRTGDGEFTVFLKGISDEKTVRKQTDEMQMFLHDVTLGSDGGDMEASAGAVLFPNGGRNARDLMESGRRALTRARQQGVGRLSF